MDGLLFAGNVRSDDERLLYMGKEGYEVDFVADPAGLKEYLLESRPRMLVVLSRPAPFLETLRGIDGVLPALVLGTENSGDNEELDSLQAGADAYVRYPYTVETMSAWVDALFKRMERCPWSKEHYSFSEVKIDVFRRTVTRRGWRIVMSATEFDLLVHLVRNSGRVVSREEILREVWKYEHCPTTRTVDNFICKLRRKLEGDTKPPRHLKTVKGVGYRLDLD